MEQLRDPRMNVAVVRPLVDKYYSLEDISVIYCLLVNRTQFLREHANVPHEQSTNITRSLLCELLANRIIRRYNEANPGPEGLLLLANILVAGFDCFQNAPPEVTQENSQALHWVQKRGGSERKLPALEIAIISESKTFLSSSACQKVVRAIYEGRVVYTPSSFIDILPDHYKQKPISLYDPRKAPIFNQYRLIVPRTRNFLEVGQFVVLLVLFIWVMSTRDSKFISTVELVFMIYTLGWALDQFASMLEHGWSVYTQNLWSFLDVTFIFIYGIYAVMRIHGIRTDNVETSTQALDVLAMGAPVLIPRLAFNLMKENMLFISLRSMMSDFAGLTLLAVWCFVGFLLSMVWLGDGAHRPITISKWMIWIWFGLDGTGIQSSTETHWLLGPILMVTFAFLGNTLFLTILVAMLSNTFAGIVTNSSQEIQFRRAVLTLEGVKSDAIFAYQPPFNIIALVMLLPLKFILTPRWFHKVNVAAIRVLNGPILLIIGLVERKILWSGLGTIGLKESHHGRPVLHRTTSRTGFWALSRGFTVHGDISAVFENDPPDGIEGNNEGGEVNPEAIEEMIRETDVDTAKRIPENKHTRTPSDSPKAERPALPSRQNSEGQSRSRNRRDSLAPYGGLRDQLRTMLNDVSIEEGNEDDIEIPPMKATGEIATRLGRLEEKMERIEDLLGRLCSNFGVDDGNKTDELAALRENVLPLEDEDSTLLSERNE